MADDLNSRLSGEDIRRFEQTLSRFDASIARQEEIVRKVLEVEKTIGKVRMASLDQYFDAYSEGLDAIIARKTSDLSDAFLIMERRAAKSSKKAAEDANKASKEAAATNSGGGSGGNNTKRIKARGGGNSQPVGDSDLEELGEEASSASNIAARLAAFKAEYISLEEQIYAIENDKENAILTSEELKAARTAKRQALSQEYAKQEIALEKTLTDLMVARTETEEDQQNRIKAIQLSRIQEAYAAEYKTIDAINQLEAERVYESENSAEAGELRSQQANAMATQKSIQQLEEQRLNWVAKKELEAKRKNNGVLTKEEAARIQLLAATKFKLDKENLDKLTKQRTAVEAAKASAGERAKLRSEINTMRTAETFEERKQALYNVTHDESGEADVGKAVSAAVLAVSDLAKQLEAKVDEIAGHKGLVDTRLQGSSNTKYAGSYWDQIVRDMTSVGAINPYFKQETFASNIDKLVEKGIAFNLTQRAFLMTVSDKIANTFDAADGTLLRLVRIQQEDSTAGRLGMESALNSFLNEMYETSEYLSDVARSVRGSLQEMEALMSGAEATEVEYQVQKWLGSLYSVGMSDAAVNSISTALGQIAAGQIEGLTGNGAGNLLIMAANDAGLSIADILTEGLDSTDTNKLLQAVVNYLAELSESAKDNKVVQQQLANVFGVKASDLKAATNLVLPGSVNAIYGSNMSYENLLGQLSDMAGSMYMRTSIAEMMTNFWENGQYTLAGGMASNPVSYLVYKMAKVVDDAAGGIDLPFLNVMGFGVDLNTTVSDLMRVAAVGGGILGSLGPMIEGLGSSFSGQAMLRQLGIGTGSGLAMTPRGDGTNNNLAGGGSTSTSGSGYIGNASGSDIKDSTIQESEDSKQKQMIEAKEEAEANQVDVLNNTVIKIYELLDDVAHGSGSLKVRVEGYGLTKGSSGNIGGVSALESAASNGTSSISSTSISGSTTLGGWTTMM